MYKCLVPAFIRRHIYVRFRFVCKHRGSKFRVKQYLWDIPCIVNLIDIYKYVFVDYHLNAVSLYNTN